MQAVNKIKDRKMDIKPHAAVNFKTIERALRSILWPLEKRNGVRRSNKSRKKGFCLGMVLFYGGGLVWPL